MKTLHKCEKTPFFILSLLVITLIGICLLVAANRVQASEIESLCLTAECGASSQLATNQSQQQSDVNTITNANNSTTVNPISVGGGDVDPSYTTLKTGENSASCANNQLIMDAGVAQSRLNDSFGNDAEAYGAGIRYVWNIDEDNQCEQQSKLLTQSLKVKNEAQVQNMCFSLMDNFKKKGLVVDESYYASHPDMRVCEWYFKQLSIQPTAFQNVPALQSKTTVITQSEPVVVQTIRKPVVNDWRVYVARVHCIENSCSNIVGMLKSLKDRDLGTNIVLRESKKYQNLHYLSVTGYATKERAEQQAKMFRDNGIPTLMVKPTNKLD